MLELLGAFGILGAVERAFGNLANMLSGGGGFMPGPLSNDSLTKAIKKVIIPQFENSFAVGGIPHWRPLAEGTIRKKGHDTILVDSGQLRQGATSINTWQISGGVATMFDPVDYGHFHISGTSHMPARNFVDLNDATADALAEELGTDVDVAVNQSLVW